MDKIDTLIDKFLKRQLNAEEKNQLLNWLKQNKDNRSYLNRIESVYNATGIIFNADNYDSEKAFNQFRQKITEEKAAKKTKLRYLIITAASVAASVILTALITYTFFSVDEPLTPLVTDAGELEITTSKGSRTRLTLADGSKIWLNSSSKLVYPAQFKGNTREVFLEGEGYFEVEPDLDKPFYVKTGMIDVKVTGTVFNLKSYPEENIIETTLIEGEVVVERNRGDAKEELITLEPNQKITFHKSEQTYKVAEEIEEEKVEQEREIRKIEKAVLVEKANIEKTISWKNNVIIFENEPFHEIVNSLERRFGVNIIFQSESIKNLRFSGTFEEISIEQALEAMRFASPFNYKIEKDTIYITDKK